MNMTRTGTSLAIAAALGMASMPGAAAFVDTWGYTATLQWANPDFTSGDGSQFTSLDVLSWGDSTETTANGIPESGDDRSGLYISPLGVPVNTGLPTIEGSIGTNAGSEDTFDVTHVNNPIDASFATLSTTDLITTLKLNPDGGPGGSPDVANLPQITFAVTFQETFNSAPCDFEIGPDCADIFSLNIAGLPVQSFNYDGIDYDVAIDNTFEVIDPVAGTLGLITQEQASTTQGFSFQITAQQDAVPTPGILALFGTGLFGLGYTVVRRRRSRA